MWKNLSFRRVVLCLTMIISVHSAVCYAHITQGSPKFSMKGTKVKYLAIFSEIKRQTGLRVWANEEISNKIANSISFDNTPLEEVMGKLLPATYTWQIRGNELLISKIGQGQSVDGSPKTNTDLSKANVTDTTSQTVDISGAVTDEKGNPIPGATILIKGQNKGTISGSNGTFNIKGVSPNAILTVSNVSFLTKDIAVRGRASLGAIALTQVEKKLDDVVVLAYSKTTNRLLTGNVSSVKAKDIQNSPVNNPILAVAGRVPGITINQASGFAGSGVDIQIQGMNSALNGTAPFVVIDGIPYPQSLLPNMANVQKFSGAGSGYGPTNGSPLSYINPADIESIEILKDADATAIYGSRAANGAIIITTKRGKEGQMKIDINAQSGIGKVSRKLNLLNNQQYLALRREAFKNDNRIPGALDYDLNGTWDTTKNTDWQKELIGNSAKYSELQLAINGGSQFVQYAISGNYHRETTVLPTDLADVKVSTRFNIDGQSRNKKFKVSVAGSYMLDNNRLPINDLTFLAATLVPVFPQLRNSDGSLNWAPNSSGTSTIRRHPLAELNSKYHNETRNLIGNLTLQYSIVDGLDIKLNSGYNNLATDEVSIRPASSFNPETRPFYIRGADFGNNQITSWIVEPQLMYQKRIGLGQLNSLLGVSFQEMNSNRKLINATGFTNDDIMENISAATSLVSPPSSAIVSQYKYNAFFTQINYNWLNKYILNFSARRDGSSRFGADNKFHNFYGFGVAWVFSEENLAKRITKSLNNFFSYGKLKFSYGTTGNDQIGDYNYLSLYQYNSFNVPYRGVSSLINNKIPNAALKWEETKKMSLGLDVGFFDERILLNGIYYRNRSSNMLLSATIPATAGPNGGLIENLPMVIQNSGFEIALSSINVRTSQLNWTSGLNFTIPVNKVVSFLDNSDNYVGTSIIGLPINVVRVYKAAGVNTETGKYQFFDKDGKIVDNPTTDASNRTKIINPNPKIYGGLTNTISYKNLSLDLLFSFTKQMGRNDPAAPAPGYSMTNQDVRALNRWREKGDQAQVQKVTTSNFGLILAHAYRFSSDAFWEDATFIRLKNISISYNLKGDVIKSSWIRNCRIFINAQNLWTITSFNGLDPETRSNFTLPPLKVITGGIQLSL